MIEEQDEEDTQFHEMCSENVDRQSAFRSVRGGFVPGCAFLNRNHEQRHTQLMNDYFVERPLYSGEIFRRRFRIKCPFFLRILADCERENIYFRQRYDAARRVGISPILKVTIAMRSLAYAFSHDANDENLRVVESTACEIVREFCKTILRVYKEEYLHTPTPADLAKLLDKAERHRFPGMIGSIDCMHWEWKNCPIAWQESFSGRKKKPIIVLEAIASVDTWIWHAFFGVPRAMNDITVLGRSPLLDNLTSGNVPGVEYEVNGNKYYMFYYLVDGIYLKWGTLIQSIRNSRTPPQHVFSMYQESFRKDVERAFGILQALFAIVNQPGRGWHTEDLSNIRLTCIILHNMIVEDERDEYKDDDFDDNDTDISTSYRARAKIYPCEGVTLENPVQRRQTLNNYMIRHDAIRSKEVNRRLQNDFIAHVYAKYG